MTISESTIREMKQLCSKHSVDFAEPNWSLNVGVADNLFSGQGPINGLRHLEEGGTMGWYFYAGETFPMADEGFKPLCAAHLCERDVFWLKYLALPEGWRFLVDRSGYEDVWFDAGLLGTVQ